MKGMHTNEKNNTFLQNGLQQLEIFVVFKVQGKSTGDSL